MYERGGSQPRCPTVHHGDAATLHNRVVNGFISTLYRKSNDNETFFSSFQSYVSILKHWLTSAALSFIFSTNSDFFP
jgi:hypothetical protein